MKSVRYPLLLLAVLIIPTSFATIFATDFISMTGYLVGYLSIYVLTTAMNHFSNQTLYSRSIRILYLVLNAFVSLLIMRTIGLGVALLYMSYILSPISAILLFGLPWIAIQMLLLYLFVRNESPEK